MLTAFVIAMRSALDMGIRAAVLATAALASCPLAHAAEPIRAVTGNTVVSSRDPAVKITLPGSARYVGSDRFVLSTRTLGKFDDCELYAFVDADSTKDIRKFYWVQFEAYLPSRPQLHHTYDSPRRATIGGLEFYVDTSVSPSGKPPESGSDEAHFYALLAARGYRRREFIYVRLVHLTDSTKRKELMIIYAERIAGKGGSQYPQSTFIASGLIRRAERSVTIEALSR